MNLWVALKAKTTVVFLYNQCYFSVHDLNLEICDDNFVMNFSYKPRFNIDSFFSLSWKLKLTVVVCISVSCEEMKVSVQAFDFPPAPSTASPPTATTGAAATAASRRTATATSSASPRPPASCSGIRDLHPRPPVQHHSALWQPSQNVSVPLRMWTFGKLG